MVAASEKPQAYAEGGAVALPTLQDLENPNFDYSTFKPGNPFTPMTQNVPMSVVQGPAYGSMGTDVYDWKAPTAKAPPPAYSTANMEAAQVYNKRVPTRAATVNVPMPSVETPTPNVPTPANDIYYPPVAPSPVAPVDSGSTPITNPLGPSPEEIRRTEAATELEALKAREEEARVAREAEAKRISDLQLAERQRQEQLNLISLENARVRDLRLAEEKRIADEKAAAVVPVAAAPVAQEPTKPRVLGLDDYRESIGTIYGGQYYSTLKNAQRLIREGRREDISSRQMEEARILSEEMDKGIYGPDDNPEGLLDSSWYSSSNEGGGE